MPVFVKIPTPLRTFASGAERLEVPHGSVNAALQKVVGEHPRLKPHLFDEAGLVRNFINVYVNQEDIRTLDGLSTELVTGDVVTLIPSIAGGLNLDVDPPSLRENRRRDVLGKRSDGAGLNHDEIQRYSRHLIMPEVGVQGQRRLKAARVLMVGAGGLGSPLGLYLAAAGIGQLGIVDFDVVDVSNLQRQVLHGTRDVGRPKLASARDRLRDVNPHVQLETHELRLSRTNAIDLMDDYDVIVDGTDNFPTRYLVNDACVLTGKPNVYGSIFRFDGQVSVFWAEHGPCYRCLFREPPPPGLVPSCAEGGVLGVLPGIIGAMQALETIKLIIGQGDSAIGRLVLFDALALEFREMKLRKDPSCPLCGPAPRITELVDYEQFCGLDQARQSEAQERAGLASITVTELKRRLDEGARIRIVDVREPHEWDIVNLSEYGATLRPLGVLLEQMSDVALDEELVVHCRSGARSAKAIRQLETVGFTNLYNLDGGILAWSDNVDPSKPKY